jgi:nicotinate-nucleotide--dimethylbenzimidazole phosphoribosyltransferase
VGAGPLPVDEHRRRPPIPIVPVDARALAHADDYDAWVRAVALSATTQTIDAGDVPLAAHRDTTGMSVGEVALAVDTGRDLAARAAAQGVGVLVARAPADRDDTAARAVVEALSGETEHGPLGTLRRLGDATTALLCGVALGAGEHGLGCVCADVAALAGAAVAAGIEPDLRPRLIAPAEPALAARLGIRTT